MEAGRFAATPEDIAKFQSQKAVSGKTRKSRRIVPRLDIPRHSAGDQFVKGPIPMNWLRAADKCGYQAMAVAVALWFAAGLQNRNPVKLTPKMLTGLSVKTRTVREILDRMQDVGIIKAEFHRGRSPLVTILSAPEVLH
jgi:hypothetical protein